MSAHKPTIFLCHAHSDKPFVRRLAADLTRLGAEVWLDEFEIRLGDSLIQKIREGIDRMDYLAVILSPDAVASEWVRREVDVAMNQEIDRRRMKVLPLLHRRCELPGFLKGKLYADFSSEANYSLALNLVVARLGLAASHVIKERPAASNDAARALLDGAMADWRFHGIILDETRLKILSQANVRPNPQQCRLIAESLEALLRRYEGAFALFYDKHDTGDEQIDATWQDIVRVNSIIRWAAANGLAKDVARMKQRARDENTYGVSPYFNTVEDVFGTT